MRQNYYKTKNVPRDKEGYFTRIKELFHLETISIINRYVPIITKLFIIFKNCKPFKYLSTDE